MFWKYSINILLTTVIISSIILDILFIIISAEYLSYLSLSRLFIILPPSSGYRGIMLNININIFEYIIVCLRFWFVIRNADIAIIIRLTAGPAKAINIFFISIDFPFWKKSSNVTVSPNGTICKVFGFNPNIIPCKYMSHFM